MGAFYQSADIKVKSLMRLPRLLF